MKFADLFAGIGGFHYALNDILSNEKNSAVLVCEIDEYAKKTYSKNHHVDINMIRNIRDFTEGDGARNLLSSVEEFDLLMGGFPCQTFSNAGKKLGFNDTTKGTLFFDIAKILEVKKPKYVLLENVKHLATHDSGKTWETIKDTLDELGYATPDDPLLLSPHEFGIPQIRWRVFIPAIRKDLIKDEKSFVFNFDDKKTDQLTKLSLDRSVKEYTIIKDAKIINALEAWGEFIANVKRPFGRTLPVIWLDHMNDDNLSDIHGYSKFLSWKQKYIKDMKNVYKNNKEWIDNWNKKWSTDKWQKRERKLEWQAGSDKYDVKKTFVQLRQSGFRFKRPTTFPTLVAMVQTSIIFDNRKSVGKWRYLSKDEVRKLQSFPSTFKFGTNDHQTYKQFGNSVNVEVVKLVLGKLLKF